MKKRLGIVTFITAATFSFAALAGNTAIVIQDGMHNSSSITQNGNKNSALVWQDGGSNKSTINQDGKHNFAGVYQDGWSNNSKIKQTP